MNFHIENLHIYWMKTRLFFEPYWEEIANYQFTLSNPLFWIIVFFCFIVLSILWDLKKALAFCLISCGVFISGTFAEKMIRSAYGVDFDPMLIRVICLIIVVMVVLYFIFVKSDN